LAAIGLVGRTDDGNAAKIIGANVFQYSPGAQRRRLKTFEGFIQHLVYITSVSGVEKHVRGVLIKDFLRQHRITDIAMDNFALPVEPAKIKLGLRFWPGDQ
jgi:hypothetical protein